MLIALEVSRTLRPRSVVKSQNSVVQSTHSAEALVHVAHSLSSAVGELIHTLPFSEPRVLPPTATDDALQSLTYQHTSQHIQPPYHMLEAAVTALLVASALLHPVR